MHRLYFLLITAFIYSIDFVPEHNKTLNYTQVFFKWPQITGSNGYVFKITDNALFQNETIFTIESNSFLSTGLLSWGSNYYWQACDQDGGNCLDVKQFSIAVLPEYFPNNVTVLDYNENSFVDGINILDFESLKFSAAITMNGEPIWFADKEEFNGNAIITTQFLPNGNFVGMSSIGYEFTKDSEIIFETPSDYGVHHQIYKATDTSYFFIDAEVEFHPCPEVCEGLIQWQGDQFLEVNKSGNIIWEWNMFNQMSLTEYNPYWIEVFTGTLPFDWSHSNSVYFDGELVYVSIRNLSRITAIDYTTKEIVWNLGNPNFMDLPTFTEDFGFSHQHSAQRISNGNILFFDNGRDNNPEISRCLEIAVDDISEPELIWEYVLPDSLLTLSRGECDRLNNGNTLITVGRKGHIVEVDEDNNIVWHLHLIDNNGNDVNVYRTDRVADIFPEKFSFETKYLDGEYGSYTLPYYEMIEFNIHNYGWGEQDIYYQLSEGDIILLENQLDLSSNMIEFDIDGINNNIYTLSVYSDEYNVSSIDFSFFDNEGDINLDNIIDILDIILCINFTLEFSLPDSFQAYSANLNGDELIDILDIVMLVNLIMNNNE